MQSLCAGADAGDTAGMPVPSPPQKLVNLPALAAVLAALVGAGAALWWPIGRSGTASDVHETSAKEATATLAVDATTQATAVPVAATATVSTVSAAAWLTRPAARQAPLLSLAELLQLKANLGTTPDPGGEFTHSGELMLFADAVQRFRQLQTAPGDAAELQGVARLLDEMLDPLVQRRDLPLPAAHALKAELLTVLQPDLNARQNLLLHWDAEQARTLGAAAR